MKVPYTEWKKGDRLRIVKLEASDYNRGFEVGDIVEYNDDCAGSIAPYVKHVDTGVVTAFTHDQLELVSGSECEQPKFVQELIAESEARIMARIEQTERTQLDAIQKMQDKLVRSISLLINS